MLNIFNNFGVVLTGYISIIGLLIMFFNMTFQWRCGLCGKLNHTEVIKMLMCMCDHMGMN